MKKTLLAIGTLCLVGSPVLAGPNANGSLILAWADGVVQCFDGGAGVEDYCGATGIQNCTDALVETTGADVIVLNVIAAFSPFSNPRLAGVAFGWSYDEEEVFLRDYGSCGDFELPNNDWPASGSGTAVTWSVAQMGQLTDVYWLAAYNYYGNPQLLALEPHPSQGAVFADDDVPSNLDPIGWLGAFGFDTTGSLPCPPDENIPGACCYLDCSCEVLPRADCTGDWLGEGTSCDPNPCSCSPPGACCFFETQECVFVTPDECDAIGGVFLGEIPCDPNPCLPIPVLDQSWGEVKGHYRNDE